MSRQIKIQALEIKLKCLASDIEKADNFILQYKLKREYDNIRSFLKRYYCSRRENEKPITERFIY